MAERVSNFSAGPATLPLPVLQQAREQLLALPDVGISVLEISHRSFPFESILDQAEANLRKLLGLPDDFAVLFIQGGATMQFSMVPMNLLRGSERVANYIVSGSWGRKAAKEAAREGQPHVAWDGAREGFVRFPDNTALDLLPNAAYTHFTSNETIQGVQCRVEPDAGGAPLICDASSDFLSRPMDIDKYSLIYAGAQKNAGPAGVTVVLMRNSLLDRLPDNQHAILDYRLYVEKRSCYNTPPVFAIYMVSLVTQWLLDEFGSLDKVAEHNQRKAGLLYDVIDDYPDFYHGHARPENRSTMNVTWTLPGEELTAAFLKQSEEAGLVGLKGHRSVGGLRASIYNAMTVEGVEALASFMQNFAAHHG